MKTTKMIMLLVMFFMCSMILSAQEDWAEIIRIEFSDLSCESSYEELRDFLLDYSKYQMQIMFWRGLVWEQNPCCRQAFFIFNSATVDVNYLILVLNNDTRITEARSDYARPRQLGLILRDDVDVEVLKSRYADYNFNGAFLHRFFNEPPRKLFTFNDYLIYPGNFINTLRLDNDVIAADFVIAHQDGAALVVFESGINLKEVFFDYPLLNFEDLDSNIIWLVRFDYSVLDEFTVLDILNNDERVSYATPNQFLLHIANVVCRPQIVMIDTSENDKTVVLKPNITVYQILL